MADIDIIRMENAYRLLHGHLRLATALRLQGEVIVDVPGDGPVRIVRAGHGFLACKNGQQLPMLCE